MKDEFSGNKREHQYWISKFVQACNKFRLTSDEAISSARFLMKQGTAANAWFESEFNQGMFPDFETFLTRFQDRCRLDPMEMLTEFNQCTIRTNEKP